MDSPYTLITDNAALAALCEKLQACDRIGVDLEGEWNLHRYGLHLCLIQICDGHETWLIDPFAATELGPFIRLMEDPAVLKISHGPQSDVILLNHKYGAEPKNIWDTEKAAQLLAYPSTSLNGLLEAKFNLSKNSKIREMDWLNRPLLPEMLDYAALDVRYLLQLHELLEAELKEKGRLEWQEEENETLDHLRYRKKENPHAEIKGANKLTPEQLVRLKWLYEVRDQLAQEMDRPGYHVIPNDKLVLLATEESISAKDWEQMKGVNPRVKQQWKRFQEGLELARHEWEQMKAMGMDGQRSARPRISGARARWGDKVTLKLEKVKEVIAGEYDIAAMIISSRTIKRIAWFEIAYTDLKRWQRHLIEEAARKHHIDLGVLLAGPPEA